MRQSVLPRALVKGVLVLSALAVGVMSAPPVFAQGAAAAPAAANDATIRVRPNAVRNTLIRPRTSFVPEMLKSVENL
jgi:hypothetical protein